jgi:hypothetical protein
MTEQLAYLKNTRQGACVIVSGDKCIDVMPRPTKPDQQIVIMQTSSAEHGAILVLTRDEAALLVSAIQQVLGRQ